MQFVPARVWAESTVEIDEWFPEGALTQDHCHERTRRIGWEFLPISLDRAVRPNRGTDESNQSKSEAQYLEL